MSLFKTVEADYEKVRAVVAEELAKHQSVVRDVEKAVQPLVPTFTPIVHDIEHEKDVLKGAVLQAVNDAKSELKNAETPLTAEAEAAVDKVVQAAVKVMIADGLKVL